MWLQIIVDDATCADAPYRQDQRWKFALSAATWPEVLRRYILTRLFAVTPPLASPALAMAANQLASTPLVDFEPIDKARLLEAACNEVLDTAQLRAALDRRMDVVEQVLSHLYFPCAGQQRSCREYQRTLLLP